MNGAGLPPDLDPLGFRSALSELQQALDALRERLEESAGGEGAHASPGRAERSRRSEPQPLAAIQEILSVLSPGLGPGELYTLAMDRVSRVLAADRAVLFVAGAGGGRLVPRSAQGFRRDDMDTISIQPGEGIVGRVFKERRMLLYSATDGADTEDAFIERFPVRDAIAVPVRAEEDVVGVLYAGRRGGGAPFSTNDVLLLLVIADRVGGALVHQGLLDRRDEHLERLTRLVRFATEGVVGGDLTVTLSRACEVGSRLVGVRAAAVGVTTGGGELLIRAAWGLPDGVETRRVATTEGLTGELYASEGPVTCRDVQGRRPAERSFLGDGGFHGCLLLPLRTRAQTVGALYLADTEVRNFSADEVEAARVLAAMTAMAIENTWLHGEAQGARDDLRSGQERRREAERAWALGEMAGGLAREFNSVFASILGKSQLLRSRAHDDPLREGLGLLEEAAWRGADTVQRLAALAATVAEDSRGAVDLTAIVRDALALTRARWKDEVEARGAPIDVVTDLESVPLVAGNATALREAAMNLVLNAVDAMPNGGRLRLATRRRDGGAELTVEDNGEGVADEVRPRVFDPFFTTRSPLRLGLGLTVVHAIVTRHRGHISVSGRDEKGTAVTIWLPRGDATPAFQVSAPPPEPERGAPSEATSILVIEDEEQVRALLVEALTQAGHRVETAADGMTGLGQFERGRFDLVLTDLALPQRSGLAVARSVKRSSPDTPVVLITGWGHLLDPERLREHGVDLMLVKPFGLERLLAVVRAALGLRPPR